MGHRVPGAGSWHRAGAGLGDASVGWVSGADALGPWQGVPRRHPKPCRKRSSSALLGIINGRVWGSQAKGKGINWEIKCCCSVRSPEPPYFARSSWSPTSAPALGATGGSGVGAAGVWPGQTPSGGLALRGDGDAEGARGFPKVLFGANLSRPAPRCSATLKGELAVPCSSSAKQRALLRLLELRVYLGWMRRTRTPPETNSRWLTLRLRS